MDPIGPPQGHNRGCIGLTFHGAMYTTVVGPFTDTRSNIVESQA